MGLDDRLNRVECKVFTARVIFKEQGLLIEVGSTLQKVILHNDCDIELYVRPF